MKTDSQVNRYPLSYNSKGSTIFDKCKISVNNHAVDPAHLYKIVTHSLYCSDILSFIISQKSAFFDNFSQIHDSVDAFKFLYLFMVTGECFSHGEGDFQVGIKGIE